MESQVETTQRYQEKVRSLQRQLTKNTEQSEEINEKVQNNMVAVQDKVRKIKYLEEELE